MVFLSHLLEEHVLHLFLLLLDLVEEGLFLGNFFAKVFLFFLKQVYLGQEVLLICSRVSNSGNSVRLLIGDHI